MVPDADTFRSALIQIFKDSQQKGITSIDVRAGGLHEKVGGYPGPNYRMPICFFVMRSFLDSQDKIVTVRPKGYGANLVIRYHIPRNKN
ncbi:MAG: hypothetical protein ABSE13_05250 [Methanoregula sp.]|jgi:5-methylcytosine-specific restriction protein A